MRLIPWVDKYMPKTSSEVQGQKAAIEQIFSFINEFKNQKKKALLTYGPVGCGKTSTIHAIAKELDLELIEVNASDARTKDALEKSIGHASKQMSLFQQKQEVTLLHA